MELRPVTVRTTLALGFRGGLNRKRLVPWGVGDLDGVVFSRWRIGG